MQLGLQVYDTQSPLPLTYYPDGHVIQAPVTEQVRQEALQGIIQTIKDVQVPHIKLLQSIY